MLDTRPGTRLSLLLASASCLLGGGGGGGGAAWATVTGDEAEPPAPTAVIMQQGDVLALGPGARARAGDFRLEYGTVAFIVSQTGGRRPADAGGALVDVVQLFPSARRLPLGRISTYLNDTFGRGAVYVKASVSRSRDLAAVQLEGYDSDDPAIEIKTQYQVGPLLRGGDALRIVTTARNTGRRPVPEYRIGDAIAWGGLARFLPGAGLSLPGAGRLLPYLLGISPSGTALYVPGGAAAGALGGGQAAGDHGGEWSNVSGAVAALPPGGSASYSRLLHVIADPSRVLCGGPAPVVGGPPVRGTVREEGGALVTIKGAVVVVERANGEAVAAAPSGAGGRFSLCAGAPGTFRLRAEAAGRVQVRPAPTVQVGPRGADVALALSRQARLNVSLREAPAGHSTPRPAPGRISVAALDDVPGRAITAGGAPVFATEKEASVMLGAGEAEVLLPPGRYRVVASRGPFYERATQEVTLRPGEARKLTLQLRRGLPASEVQGVRCAALRALPPAEAASTVARAEGLDLLLAEEGGRAAGDPAIVAAAELLAGSKGRFTLYPLAPGAPLPEARLLPGGAALAEVLRRVSGEAGAPPVLQAELPPGADAGGFDAREVWTGAATARVGDHVRAWLAALAAGRLQSAVAGADPRAGLAELGAARTCFGLSESARPLSAGSMLRVAVQRGDLVLTNGPWLRVSANGAGLGELASAPDGKVAVRVSAFGASHVDVRELEIWVGARRAALIPVPPTGTPLRYQGVTNLQVDRDAAIVVVARGGLPLSPRLPGVTPLALTNPVLIDRDGDGRYLASTPGRSPAKR